MHMQIQFRRSVENGERYGFLMIFDLNNDFIKGKKISIDLADFLIEGGMSHEG